MHEARGKTTGQTMRRTLSRRKPHYTPLTPGRPRLSQQETSAQNARINGPPTGLHLQTIILSGRHRLLAMMMMVMMITLMIQIHEPTVQSQSQSYS